MFNIEKKNYGVALTFDGFIKKEEMQEWVNETKKVVPTMNNAFGVLVDMRTMKTLPRDSQELMQEGQILFKQKGMERSVVILNSATVTMQFKKIAKETGIYQWERYIDASKVINWETVAKSWLEKAIDPDA